MRRKRRNKKILRIILTALLVVAFVAAIGSSFDMESICSKRGFRKGK